ncbi:uncharacterized protein LOC111618387 [Centruroides sculpturatus]|uniref:uncharacterized protein LOC111618387 n=1 Tax=Centruroides sculpturatus TaxID=218467 RepID=UPI000C6D2235|nr:uncharacterized protein LOC111618387 [Centruroides sculpturatus]
MFNMEKHSVRKMYMCYLAETIIVFLCSVTLAVGVKQDNRHLFLPWICCVFLECFGLVAIVIFIIYSIIVRGFQLVFILMLFFVFTGFLFLVYMLLCVLSQYQLLANGILPTAYRIANKSSSYDIENRIAYITPSYGMPQEISPYGMPVAVATYQTVSHDKSVSTNA